jgi:uncharacterized oxidoreductase
VPSIPANQLTEFATQLLMAAGASEEESAIVGESLVLANLCGYDSHGVMRLPFYADMIACKDTIPGAELRVIRDAPSLYVADAQWGFGRVQCGKVLRQLIEKAKLTGIAAGSLFHSSHVGRVGEYCEIAAAEGLVSQVMVNTHGAARRVAPPGGTQPRLGTNPLALGVPHRDEPLVLDFSTSATAEGKVRVKSIAGEQCPPGWILDSNGEPTTDPNALYADPPGTILPMGGDQAYKGFGLSMMIDIFSGALSGGLVSRETPITPKGNCVFIQVMSPEFFGGAEHFAQQTEELAAFIRGCQKKQGVDRILLPGDPERASKAQKAAGVPIDHENWQKLCAFAESLNVTPPM